MQQLSDLTEVWQAGFKSFTCHMRPPGGSLPTPGLTEDKKIRFLHNQPSSCVENLSIRPSKGTEAVLQYSLEVVLLIYCDPESIYLFFVA